jgi:hypothetical protein
MSQYDQNLPELLALYEIPILNSKHTATGRQMVLTQIEQLSERIPMRPFDL